MFHEDKILRKTQSLCPECLKVIDATLCLKEEKVIMKKECKEHGVFRDLYWSDYTLYEKAKSFQIDGDALENSQTSRERGCPYDCGLCNEHKTQSILANIDLTNRCNLKCPVCFANAENERHIYEPSFSRVVEMLLNLRNQKPHPCEAIQFSGGEPTLRDDLEELIRTAKKLGFKHILLATNGIRLAKSKVFCKKLREAGLATLYLQFDGITDDVYRRLRGANLLKVKKRVIENCKNPQTPNVTLVPTLLKGVNDNQVGDIVRFASKNNRVVKSVNFQPISFSGRVEFGELENSRITIPDFLKLLEEQTNGEILQEDFYPIPSVIPFSHFVEALKNSKELEFTCHFLCGAATYVFVEKEKMIPITRFIDVEGILEFLEDISKREIKTKLDRIRAISETIRELRRCYDKKEAPSSVNVEKMFVKIIRGGGGGTLSEFHKNTLLVGCMHFMDRYNFDLERVRRCCIHYALPDGRIVPFYSYNTIHRKKFEKDWYFK